MSILIQKNGAFVSFLQGGFVRATLNEDCTMNLSNKRQGIEFIDIDGKSYFLPFQAVTSTQVAPAAAVPFTGTLVQLWQLLTGLFFNELHSTAGIITSDDVINLSGVTGATVTDALNNLAAGGGLENNIVSTAVNYSILTSDYIVYATASNIGIRLPTIGTNIGQFYRIYANNNSINVLCDDPSGDRIIGQISISLKKWDSATFRAIYTNQWLISD